MDQPGKVANPARGQLNRENEYSPVPVRDGFSRPVPRQPAHLHTQADYGWAIAASRLKGVESIWGSTAGNK